MAFHDSLFPVDIALNSEGGPERRTDIVSLHSGHEYRNSPWAGSRRRFNAGYGVKSLEDIEAIIAFFEARHGRLHSFRFRDPFDHKSCGVRENPQFTDQGIAIGDGVTTEFPLIKTYRQGEGSYSREITKPALGTVQIAVSGVFLVEGVGFTVDEMTGLVILQTPPSTGEQITAGYVFDTPVRFDTDQLQISLAAFKAGDIPNIPLIEVLS